MTWFPSIVPQPLSQSAPARPTDHVKNVPCPLCVRAGSDAKGLTPRTGADSVRASSLTSSFTVINPPAHQSFARNPSTQHCLRHHNGQRPHRSRERARPGQTTPSPTSTRSGSSVGPSSAALSNTSERREGLVKTCGRVLDPTSRLGMSGAERQRRRTGRRPDRSLRFWVTGRSVGRQDRVGQHARP
jgi:hypothetical protein